MSMVKYRLKEVASDLGITPKEVAEIISRFFEKPKSNTQILTDEELNVVFDCVTQAHQIDSLEQVFAAKPTKPAAPAPKAEEAKKQEAPKQAKPAPQAEAQQPQQPSAQPAKPKEPERKRERRVVDTSAVQVNANRFADVDNLVSERVQNYQGGKQRIGGKKGQQQNKKDNKFRGNKSRN